MSINQKWKGAAPNFNNNVSLAKHKEILLENSLQKINTAVKNNALALLCTKKYLNLVSQIWFLDSINKHKKIIILNSNASQTLNKELTLNPTITLNKSIKL